MSVRLPELLTEADLPGPELRAAALDGQLYAVADAADSCFAGVLLEVALAADRIYMLVDGDQRIALATSVANAGANPTATGLTRLEARFFGTAEHIGGIECGKVGDDRTAQHLASIETRD